MKLIIGKKGSGKTKMLIDSVNAAVETSKGAVVCIEKGDKLKFDVNYKARLIDTDEYKITDGKSLYGFIAGILASNHDVTDIFVDSAYKICGNDNDNFDTFITALDAILKSDDGNAVNCVITASVPVEEASDTVKKYI